MQTRADFFAGGGAAEIDGLEAARSFAEAVAGRAVEGFEVVMDGGAMTTRYHGRDGMFAGWSDFLAPFETIRITPEELVETPDEDCVVEFVRMAGRPKGTAGEVVQEAAAVWRVRDGRIVSVEFHIDRAAALRSGGVAA
jgi:hypothetical protein